MLLFFNLLIFPKHIRFPTQLNLFLINIQLIAITQTNLINISLNLKIPTCKHPLSFFFSFFPLLILFDTLLPSLFRPLSCQSITRNHSLFSFCIHSFLAFFTWLISLFMNSFATWHDHFVKIPLVIVVSTSLFGFEINFTLFFRFN